MEVTWNRTNFKRLGRVRVQVWETIFAIFVPVGLLSYVFGRRWLDGDCGDESNKDL
jgi:hypothetical protein